MGVVNDMKSSETSCYNAKVDTCSDTSKSRKDEAPGIKKQAPYPKYNAQGGISTALLH